MKCAYVTTSNTITTTTHNPHHYHNRHLSLLRNNTRVTFSCLQTNVQTRLAVTRTHARTHALQVMMPKSELAALIEPRRAAKQARVAEAEAREKREKAKMASHPSTRPELYAPPPDKGPPPKPVKPRKPTPNVLKLMAGEDPHPLGPLATLSKALQERREVVVQIRDSRCVRGTCRGVVAAFDRHMNVVLTDVTEQLSRRVLRQRTDPPPPDCNARQRARHNRPRIVVDIVTRHIDQLLIRGDSIATVQLPDMYLG